MKLTLEELKKARKNRLQEKRKNQLKKKVKVPRGIITETILS